MDNLSELINQYIENCRFMKGLDEKTIKAYAIDFKQFATFQNAESEWCSKQFIEAYIKNLYQQYQPRSVKRKIACIKAFFHYLELEENIVMSPFHIMRYKHREAIVLPRTIPVDIVTQMLNYAYHAASITGKSIHYYRSINRDIAVLELLFASGVRVGELCILKPNDIDLGNRIIRVNGKGSKERYIQITNSSVIYALKKHRIFYLNEIKKCGYFFINNRGDRLSEQSVRFIVDKYAKATNSKIHITPHMFRHTIATLLLEEDVDIRYIQELLGHSSKTTTQIYTHISLSTQKRILTKKHPRNRIKIEDK